MANELAEAFKAATARQQTAQEAARTVARELADKREAERQAAAGKVEPS